MIYLLKIVQFIFKILIYLLYPFALLTGETDKIREKTKNKYKFVYYLISIPHWIIFPITFSWTLLSFQYFHIQEQINKLHKIKYGNWRCRFCKYRLMYDKSIL